MIFRVFLRDVPAIAEHVPPGRTLRLTDPLPGQKQEAKERRVRRTGLPEPAQLLIGQHPIARRFRAAHELVGQPIDGGDLEIAGIDGEALELDPPLRFRTKPQALRVRIAPQHRAPHHPPTSRKARGTQSAPSP